MLISSLTPIFGSKTKAQEILLLLHHAKPVVRQGFYAAEIPIVKEFCERNNLFLVHSRFKVLLTDKDTYSNQGVRIPEDDPRSGMYFLYFSQDQEKAWQTSYYELIRNDRELGLGLGYPKCCVDFFCAQFSEYNPNPIHLPTNLFTNMTKRDQDAVILSHFPCNSDCKSSLTLAQKYLAALQEQDLVRAQELLRLLQV